MTRQKPYDNAIAERVNGVLKMEFDLEKLSKHVAAKHRLICYYI